MRCWRRRAVAAAARQPILVAGLGGLVVVAPLLAHMAGERAATTIGLMLDEPEFSQLIVAGGLLPAFSAGVIAAARTPTLQMLSAQVAAAPITRASGAVGLLLPLLAPAAVGAAIMAAALLPLAQATPGGSAAALDWLAALLVAATAGAVLALSGLAFARGSIRTAAAGATAVVAVWLACGLAAHAPLLGPVAVVAAALADGGGGYGVAALVAAGCAGVAAWVGMVAVLPSAGTARRARRRSVPLPRGAIGVSLLMPSLLAARQGAIRLQVVAVTVIGVAGPLVLTKLGAMPSSIAVVLGASTLVAGALVVPLTAFGLNADGRWVAVGSVIDERVHMAAVAAGAQAAGLALALGPSLVLATLAGGWPGVSGAMSTAGLAVAAATTAGAVLPWTPQRSGDQFVCYVATGALVAGLLLVRQWVAGLADSTLVNAALPVAALLVATMLSATVRGGRAR
jgi:hypothetical protein